LLVITQDGLTDAFDGLHMGMTAENVAREWNITREAQDLFALQSQHKCQKAIEAGDFRGEITPVPIKSKTGVYQVADDEFPRPGSTIEGLQKLRACFLKDGTGTVTAGNASVSRKWKLVAFNLSCVSSVGVKRV